jgi:hypothetical protein
MKHLFLSAALAAALLGTLTSHTPATSHTTATVANDSPALAAMFEKYWDERAKLYPLEATSQGDNRYNDQLPNDNTVAYRATQRQFFQQYLDALKKFDRSKLSENDRVSYDIFLYDMQMRLEGLKQNTWMMPINQMSGLPISAGSAGRGLRQSALQNHPGLRQLAEQGARLPRVGRFGHRQLPPRHAGRRGPTPSAGGENAAPDAGHGYYRPQQEHLLRARCQVSGHRARRRPAAPHCRVSAGY